MNDTKILIVEDNPIVAEDIRLKLGHMGYEVVTIATTGEEAIEAADANPPDIALMDIRLGDRMNGIDTASKIRKKHHTPIIYLTAFADDETIARAKITEPYGYIIKPFDDSELKSAIEIANYKQKSERKVKESQRWLETTLKSIGDGVIATDNKGKVVFMNPVAELLTGWDGADAEGASVSNVFNIVSEITGNVQDDPVERVLKEGIVVGLANHTLLKCKDGKMIPITDSGAPIKDDKGEIIGVVLVFRDQLEELEAQKALEESERKLSTLVENLPGMAYRCLSNRKFTMLYISNGCQMVTGYAPSELINNHLIAYSDLIVAEDRETVWLEIQRSIEEDRSFTLEYRIRDKDGKIKWLWEKGVCVGLHSESQYVLEGFISDITDLKRTETDALKLAAAIEQSDESVLITDTDSKIEYVNPAFERITGYAREEILGKNPRLLQSGKHDQQFYKDLWGKLLEKKVWRGRFQNKRKDKKWSMKMLPFRRFWIRMEISSTL